MATRGRPRFGVLEEPEKFAELVSRKVLKRTGHQFSTRHAKKAAEEILRDAAWGDRPKYNNYSGNLNRSYMVRVRLSDVEYEYMTPDNVSAKPRLYSQANIPMQRWAGRFDRARDASEVKEAKESIANKKKGSRNVPDWLNRYKSFEELTKGHVGGRRYFRITKTRHPVKKSVRQERRKGKYHNRQDKYLRAVKDFEEKYSGNGYIHRYRERSKYSKEDKRFVSASDVRNRSSYQVSLLNLTPYAGCVEEKGYKVIDYGREKHYRDIVRKAFRQSVTTGVKWVCDQMNRDTRGRFTSKR